AVTLTPQGPSPMAAPISCPIAQLLSWSTAADRTAPSCAPERISCTIICPMRPPTPRIPILTGDVVWVMAGISVLVVFAGDAVVAPVEFLFNGEQQPVDRRFGFEAVVDIHIADDGQGRALRRGQRDGGIDDV